MSITNFKIRVERSKVCSDEFEFSRQRNGGQRKKEQHDAVSGCSGTGKKSSTVRSLSWLGEEAQMVNDDNTNVFPSSSQREYPPTYAKRTAYYISYMLRDGASLRLYLSSCMHLAYAVRHHYSLYETLTKDGAAILFPVVESEGGDARIES